VRFAFHSLSTRFSLVLVLVLLPIADVLHLLPTALVFVVPFLVLAVVCVAVNLFVDVLFVAHDMQSTDKLKTYKPAKVS
jgi:hypothetical protein